MNLETNFSFRITLSYGKVESASRIIDIHMISCEYSKLCPFSEFETIPRITDMAIRALQSKKLSSFDSLSLW